MTPSERLEQLNLTLPKVTSPVGSYIPAIRTGRQILSSGQLPVRDGTLLYLGKVPTNVTVEDAAGSASVAVLNALAACASVAGGLDAITRIVRLCVFVNSAPGFTEQAKVANGASDLLVKLFGDAGRHARSAVGVAELPLNSALELELVVEANP